jgi:hypothetical protein
MRIFKIIRDLIYYLYDGAVAQCCQRVLEKSIKIAGSYTPKTANFKIFPIPLAVNT